MAEFLGEQFVPPERFNWRRVTKMARAAKAGGDTAELDGLAAMDAVVDTCLRREDVDRFDALCDEHGVDTEHLMEFVASVVAEVAERPTQRPSGSSSGQRSTEGASPAGSSSPDTDLWDGTRPDLVLFVREAQEAQRARSTA